jgi:hypothetical protein
MSDDFERRDSAAKVVSLSNNITGVTDDSKSSRLGLWDALELHGNWKRELQSPESDGRRPDGEPFSPVVGYGSPAVAWGEVCNLLEGGVLEWWGRKNDPTLERSKLPASAASEFKIASLERSNFEGPHGIKIYDAVFIQVKPGLASLASDSVGKKRGPKPVEALSGVMHNLILRYINDGKGLPANCEALVQDLKIASKGLPQRQTTALRAYISENFQWLYVATKDRNLR